jgi:hypothetical protein
VGEREPRSSWPAPGAGPSYLAEKNGVNGVQRYGHAPLTHCLACSNYRLMPQATAYKAGLLPCYGWPQAVVL